MHRKFFRSTIVKIVILIILLVLPINIMTLILSNKVLQENQKQIENEYQNTLDLSTKNVESTLDRISKRLIYLSMETEFIQLAQDLDTLSEMETAELLRQVSNSLSDIAIDYPLVDLMYFHFPESEYVISDGYPGVPFESCRQFIRDEAENEDSQKQYTKIVMIDETPMLYTSNTWNGSNFGVMINLERLLQRQDFIRQETGTALFFTDTSNQVLTKSGQEYLNEQGMTYGEILGSDQFGTFTSEIPGTDLLLVMVVSWDSLIANVPATLNVFRMISILLTILVIPVLLLYIYRQVSRPLSRLTRAIDKIEGGDLKYRIEAGRESREFEQINRNFNSMMDQVHHLKIDVYEKELERKSIMMRYLSQQIQPHFILNAMNIIYCYEPEEYSLIQKMVLCISKYFRYIVKVNAKFVMLYQEMEHIQNYFEIQKARFPDLFFAIVEYDETIREALIPPLVVQNFAENAIKHSLKIGNKITIYVIAEKVVLDGEEKIRIRLADTGEGITDEALDHIRVFRETGVPQDGLGLGTQNTIERLKHIYWDRASLRIWRDETYSGTNVELILPFYNAGDEEKEGLYESTSGR
ncbi:MAG: sensor histidine kinase [Lachnospiraceae bacterium]